MKTNFRQIKNLIVKLEKKEKELAIYKSKVNKLENEVNELQEQLTNLLNKTNDNEQTNTFSSYSA